jgi:hypothetical protein
MCPSAAHWPREATDKHPSALCRVQLVIESTRVANSNLLPQLFDAVSVPVEQIMAQIRGKDAAKVQARVVYMDSQLRVTRTLPDNQLFIYRRVL